MTPSSKQVLDQARRVCPECEADDIIKYGKRNGVQVYKCKPCDKKFTANGALPGRRVPPEQVGQAISMFFDGMSYRDIQRNMQQQFGFTPSTATVYEWVVQYTTLGQKLMGDFKAQTGDTWVADETVLKVDGGKLWLWNVVDVDSRYLLATHISKTRTIKDAVTLFRKAKRSASTAPKEVITDKLRAYEDGIERVFGAATKHIQSEGIRAELNNNLSERMQGTIKERTKVMRGLEFKRTAETFIDGFTLYYNHLRPHSALGGKTPARAADIPFVFRDWVEVNYLRDETFSKPKAREVFQNNVFRHRGRNRL